MRRLGAAAEAARLHERGLRRTHGTRAAVSQRTVQRGKSKGPCGGWSDGKEALELLFRMAASQSQGAGTSSGCTDIPERVCPSAMLNSPTIAATRRQEGTAVRAARAMGVGTAKDIAQYFHIDAWWDRLTVNGRRAPAKPTRGSISSSRRAVSTGKREGWKPSAYVVPGAGSAFGESRAVVSPFDP